MSQTSVIAGTLVIAYIVFITVKGDLPAWLGMLGIGPNAGICGVTAGSGGSGGSGSGDCNLLDWHTWGDCVTVNPTKV